MEKVPVRLNVDIEMAAALAKWEGGVEHRGLRREPRERIPTFSPDKSAINQVLP